VTAGTPALTASLRHQPCSAGRAERRSRAAGLSCRSEFGDAPLNSDPRPAWLVVGASGRRESISGGRCVRRFVGTSGRTSAPGIWRM
jgi:hypothetical protein